MLIWDNAKQGTFSQDERETIICSDSKETVICTSDTPTVTRVIKLYSEILDIDVLYYNVSSTTGEKYPTEVRVKIPKGRFVTLRSLKSKSTDEDE